MVTFTYKSGGGSLPLLCILGRVKVCIMGRALRVVSQCSGVVDIDEPVFCLV